MKLLKLFPVALAAFALASCSTEDFESSKTQDLANKGDLRIVWDTVDGNEETRSLSDNKFNGPFFEAGDQIFVYDNLMHSTDVYAFQENAFYFDPQFEGDKPIIQGNEVAYAVYPGKYWDFTEEEEVVKAPKGYVLRTEVGTPTCVDIKIPHVLRYKEIDGQYGYEIPFFGAASYHGTPGAEGTYIQADNFRALTARLRIKLDNAFGNVSYLRLSNTAGKPLSGTLTAKLYTGDDRTKSMLQVVDKDYTVFPEIYIDLRNVPSNLSYVYIPVVCGPDYDNLLNGDTDGITLDYSSVRTEDDPTKIAATDWKPTGMKFPGEVFSPNSRHAGKHTFTLTGMNPKKVSDLLAQYKESTSDITLNLKNDFTINAGDATIDNVVYLPEFTKEDMTVTITLDETFAHPGSLTNTAHDALVVKNAEGVEATNAKVILDLGPITPDAGDLNLTVDAPGADVQVIGDFSGQTAFELLNAKKVTIGAAGKATKWTNAALAVNWGADGEGVKEIEIAKDAEVKAAANVNLYNTVNKKFTVNGKLDITGYAVSFSGAASQTEEFVIGADGEVAAKFVGATNSAALTTITINGKLNASGSIALYSPQNVATNITITGEVVNAVRAQNVSTNVTISGEGKITGTYGSINGVVENHEVKAGVITITSKASPVVAGNVSTMGNVVVATDEEAEAIAGTLNMKGANKTLKLTQGYVNEINVNVGNTGSWEDNKITINFDDANGLVAFNKLTVADNNSVEYNKSTWCGQKITNTTYKDKLTTYTNAKAAEIADGFTSGSANTVFTAAQLASLTTQANVEILNQIDLDRKDTWTGLTSVTSALKGYKHTISNLCLTHDDAKGLVNSLSGTAADLTIAGVTATKAADAAGIGALAGESTGTSVSNVTVSGIDIKAASGKKLTNVGGVIGNNKADITLATVTVSGTIDGYSALGGLVGTTEKKVTATSCTASGISFKQSYDSGKSMDLAYGSVGAFIGKVTGDQVITITGATAPALDAFFTNNGNLKKGKMFTSDTDASTGNFYTYTPFQVLVGLSCDAAHPTKPTIAESNLNGTTSLGNAAFGTTSKVASTSPYKEYMWGWTTKAINARQQR